MFSDQLEHEPGEFFGRWREFGLIQKALRFDVELHRAGGREGEDLIERRHLRSEDRLLFWKIRIPNRSAIPFTDLGERELPYYGPALGTRADGRMKDGIVRYDNNVIFGNRHVELEHVHTGIDRILKRRNCVLRP